LAQTLLRRVPDALSRRRPAAAVKRGLFDFGEDRRTIDRRECNALDTEGSHVRKARPADRRRNDACRPPARIAARECVLGSCLKVAVARTALRHDSFMVTSDELLRFRPPGSSGAQLQASTTRAN
jgi:hypothetical protein